MYELIEHKKLDSAAAEIVFTNIPQIYTDLYVVVSARSSGTANNYTGLKINGVNTSQSSRFLYGTGSGVGSVALTGASDYNLIAYMTLSSDTSNTFASSTFYIPNYTSSAAKTVSIDAVTENNATAASQMIMAGLWNSTSAITSLSVVSVAGSSLQASGNLAQNSSATLYGVNRTAGRGKPKAIGGNITYSNGYWVHTFTGSGTFSTTQSLNVDALVVAGGGGTGFHIPGGGGAGGFLTPSVNLTRGSYAVIVGAGGAAGATEGVPQGSQGSPSSAFFSTAIGGGYGGTRQLTPASGGSGGSGGGGGGGGNGNTVTGGSATSGQGNAGGNGYTYPDGRAAGGGGGGAGAAGAAGSFGAGGNGGAGALWNGSYYAGGGGGSSGTSSGTGGIGGGGNATNFGSNTLAQNGTANTGGGGGGGEYGASGGSGVVIIRYRAD